MLIRHYRLLKKFLITIKMFKDFFRLHQKLIKKSEPKIEESIAEGTKLRRERIAEIKREEKNINNLMFQYYF